MTTEPIRTAVVAIGGNSLIKDNQHSDLPHQWDAVRETASHIASMVAAGWTTVITHGNGPQVGFNLRRSELAAGELHPISLDIIDAHTQGGIGYMLQQTLANEFHQRQINRHCVALVTQTLVDANDPAFVNPTKPIGGFMDAATAQRYAAEGWRVIDDAGRGWRRVVASPQPLAIIEQAIIRQAIDLGWIVIAAGGGGIPVVRNQKGELRGVYAVIDKDRASSLLAVTLHADLFLISTGVEKVAINFGKPNQLDLTQITLAEARAYLAEGHFAAGSMQPKIEACINFLAGSSNPHAHALITNPENIAHALQGKTGTKIMLK